VIGEGVSIFLQRTHSGHKRPKCGSWRKAAKDRGAETNSLHRSHFAPLGTTPRPTARTVWGTRGPRFKSGHPDYSVSNPRPNGRGVAPRRAPAADNSTESRAVQKANEAVGALRANGHGLGGGHADGLHEQAVGPFWSGKRCKTRVRGLVSPDANGRLGANRGRSSKPLVGNQ
jgi:hypothetical protein